MSEQKPFDMETPAEEVKEQAEAKPAKARAKKRKKSRVSVRLAAILLVFALLFGVVVGYALGRVNSRNALIEAEIAIGELNARISELEGSWADMEGLSAENIDALSLLSGEVDDENGEESFFGDDEAILGYEEGAAESVAVAEFKGGQLMSNEVASAYNDQVAGYIFSGYTEDEIPETLLTDLLEEMTSQKILMAKAQEMGVYELTAADKDEIAKEAQRTMDEMIALFRSFIDTEGKDESAVIEETRAYLAEYEGISYDSVYAMLSENWWMEKLYNEVVRDVKIESTDIIELYNEKMEAQKAAFSEYPDDFEASQMSGETIVYNLEGYRAVRLLAIEPDEPGAAETAAMIEEEILMLDPEKDAETIAAYRAELDQIYLTPEAVMMGITAELDNGASFSDMLARHGDDIGMKDETLKNTGYYVSENSLLWPEQMVDAAFALGKSGDISAPFRMNGSVCIIEYVGDVTPGEVSIDATYDAISEEALDIKRSETYEEQINKWITEADIKYYPERMR